MKKYTRIMSTAAVALLISAASFPVFALDLQQARTGGQLGEQADGYVAVLQQSPEAKELAAQVNQRRREEYQRISKENGQPVDIVGKLAAEQIVQKLAPGSMYQGADGSWKKR